MKRFLAMMLCLVMVLSSSIPVGATVSDFGAEAAQIEDVDADMDAAQTEGTVIDVTDFGADPSGKNDSVIPVQKALEAAKEVEGPVTLSFPEGEYHFWPEDATVRRIYISNSTTPSSTDLEENAIRTIGILMENIDDLTLEGNGSTFLFHGKMMSFVSIDCKNLTIQNLTYDFVLPAVIDLTVEKVEGNTAQVYMPDVFEYEIVNGNNLVFYGETSPKTGQPYWSLSGHPYDQVNEMNTGEIYRRWDGCKVLFENCTSIEEIGNQRFLFTYSATPNAQAGFNVQIKQTVRDNPSMLLWTSENVVLKNIDAMHLHSFGIVGQFSKDITLDDVNVIADERKGTLTAAAADMMQMSGCGGKITVKNCNFTNPQDDPINIHGTFLQVQEVIDANTIKVRYMERETYGFPNYYVGDEVEIISRNTLNTVGESYKVVAVENPAEEDYTKENRKLITITLDREIPEEVVNSCSSYVVENITYTPEVHITDCVFDQSPVRGVLCTTRKKVVIENCIFRNMNMSSIYISDDANGWYESGYCRDVTIRNNVFELCNNSSINFGPVVYYPDQNDPLHKNVVIEGNIFILKDKTAIAMTGVENVTIRNNTFIPYEDEITATLTADNTTLQVNADAATNLNLETPVHTSALFSFSCCKNVVIEDNHYGEGLNVRVSTSNMDSAQVSTTEAAINADQYVEDALTDAEIMYQSTDEAVAQFTAGEITGIAPGQADVYAVVRTADGRIFESNRVSVQVVEESTEVLAALTVTAEKDTLTQVDETLQMSVAATPSTAVVGTVTWSVTDAVTGEATDAAVIDENGLLTAKASGIVEVKAVTESGISNTKVISLSIGGEMNYVTIEYPVDGQIQEITEDAITVYPSNKNGFCDNVNRPENLITIPLPSDNETYEATVLLTGDPISTYEEVGFGIMKDVDSYVSVSTKKHLGTMLYYEVNTDFSESLRISNIGSPAYLKITKNGNLYAGYYKKAAEDEWTKIAEKEVAIGSDLKLVMWAANRSSGVAGNYVWSELTINGEAYKFKGNNNAPAASDAVLALDEAAGKVSASYTFADVDGNAEGTSKVFWYMADEENGVYRRLSGNVSAELDYSDYAGGKYVKALVVPCDVYGTAGEAAWTQTVQLPEKEVADSGSYEGASINAYLKNLDLGTDLSPAFERTTMRYMASALDSTESLPLNCQVEDAGASMTVTVNDEVLAENVTEYSGDITLLSGFNYVYVDIVAEDGVTEKTYRVVVVRPGYEDGTLADLKFNGETIPDFDPEVTEYRIVMDKPEDVTLEATVNNHRARLILSDGKTSTGETSATWTTVPGTNTYVAAVRSESYGTYKYYTVNVKVPGLDNADIQNVDFTDITWDKNFAADVTEYQGTTNKHYTTVTLETIDLDADIKVTGNGVTFKSENGLLNANLPLSVGDNTFVVEVASATAVKTYTFNISRTSIVYLSDLDWISAQAGYGSVQRDCETDGIGIRLTGEDGQAVSYDKGIGTHAASEIIYDLTGKGYTAFQSYVGVDYCQNFDTSPAAVTFKVYLNSKDGDPVFNSGEMLYNTPQIYVDIPISETDTTLYLVVEQGSVNWNDHADWADAKFVVKGESYVPEKLEIITQPTDVSANKGDNAVVSVEAKGEGLTYTWYYKKANGNKYYRSGIGSGNTYSIPMYAYRDGQQVYCVITDAYGNSVQSNTATLTLSTGTIVIVKQPEDAVAARGENAVVTVEAEGEGLVYTWYYKKAGGSKFYVSGIGEGNTYSIPMYAYRDGYKIYCVITDVNGATVQTNTVTLTMK